MRLVYIYHSGFVVEAEGFSILIDYFKDTNPGPAKGFVRGANSVQRARAIKPCMTISRSMQSKRGITR